MNKLPINQIRITGSRQRSEFEESKISELADSILRLGLLQPIVVRQGTEIPEHYELVAGERRLRACKLLDWEEIPVVWLESLDPDDAFEAELDENIRRVDLPWQDRVRAEAELHRRRARQSGQPQTLSATAKEVFQTEVPAPTQIAHIRDALVMEQHLDDPEVRKAASLKDALKIIRRKVEAEHRANLATMFNPDSSPHTPLWGDALMHLAGLEPGQFDCIITDPPYGIGADDFGTQAKLGHAYSDSPEEFKNLITIFAKEAARVTKPEAHLYMFFDFRWWDYIKLNLELSGWKVWHRPLIWAKGNGMLPAPELGPRNTYELIVFANKGSRRTLSVRNDVIVVDPVTSLRHGAQKPVQLYTDLLSRSCLPGDRILDPFMGSGTVFPAANNLRLQATGIELNEDTYNLALTRLEETMTEELL